MCDVFAEVNAVSPISAAELFDVLQFTAGQFENFYLLAVILRTLSPKCVKHSSSVKCKNA